MEHQFWGGIIGNHIVGPHFFHVHLNGAMYLDFLQNELNRLLEDIPPNIREDMWIQHDGAPAHCTSDVRDFLNERFPNRWIGRGGPVAWPARSPDPTKMDFFCGATLKMSCTKQSQRQCRTCGVELRNLSEV